jgi:hypothetical protein
MTNRFETLKEEQEKLNEKQARKNVRACRIL